MEQGPRHPRARGLLHGQSLTVRCLLAGDRSTGGTNGVGKTHLLGQLAHRRGGYCILSLAFMISPPPPDRAGEAAMGLLLLFPFMFLALVFGLLLFVRKAYELS